MKAKLTKTFVDALEPDPDPKKRRTVWDLELPAFGVTVTPPGRMGGGVKSYIVQYRVGGRGGKLRRYTIGRHGREWQPGMARDQAREVLRQVRSGNDPFLDKKNRIEQLRLDSLAKSQADDQSRRLAFKEISAEFLERYAKPNQPRSWRLTEAALVELGEVFGMRRIDELPRDVIRSQLEQLAERSASVGINAHKSLRKMYNWLVDEQIIPEGAHPMRSMSAPAKIKARKRVLTSAELKEVWQAADVIGSAIGDLYKGLILTGQRLREVAEAEWSELHFDQAVWTIPEHRMKRDPDDDRAEHLVPLSALAVTLFQSRPRLAPPAVEIDGKKKQPPAKFVFTTRGVAAISGFSKGRKRLDAAIAQARNAMGPLPGEDEVREMSAWVNHDLRRTMSTALQALGVQPYIIDLMQDHRIAGVARVSRHYQHWEYFEEKRDAMLLWEQYLRGALFGDEQYLDLVRKVDFRVLVKQ